MRIEVYGKQDCRLCESMKRKLAVFLSKWGVSDRVPVEFMDMETPLAAAEAAFHDVRKIPTVLVKHTGGDVVARWEGPRLDSDELRNSLEVTGVGAAA